MNGRCAVPSSYRCSFTRSSTSIVVRFMAVWVSNTDSTIKSAQHASRIPRCFNSGYQENISTLPSVTCINDRWLGQGIVPLFPSESHGVSRKALPHSSWRRVAGFVGREQAPMTPAGLTSQAFSPLFEWIAPRSACADQAAPGSDTPHCPAVPD